MIITAEIKKIVIIIEGIINVIVYIVVIDNYMIDIINFIIISLILKL